MNSKQLNIMNNLEQSYKKILEVLSKFFGNKLQNYQRRTPKMSDLEVVSLALTAEYLSIDSECQLFRKIPESIKSKIERSVFNRRRRKLFPYIEQIRTKIAQEFMDLIEDLYNNLSRLDYIGKKPDGGIFVAETTNENQDIVRRTRSLLVD